MNPRLRALAQFCALAAILALLLLIFPRAFVIAELAARELFYLWWVILLIALAIWLIWGISRRPK